MAKNDENRAYSAWAKKYRTELAGVDTSQVRSSILLANINPGAPAKQISDALGALLGGLDRGTSGTMLSQVRAFVADGRQPGWARLAAALHIGDTDTVTALARHTGTLAAVPTPSYFYRPAPDGAAALSAVRRVRLNMVRWLSGRNLEVAELPGVLGELRGCSWWDSVAGGAMLARQTRWDGVELTTALDTIAAMDIDPVTRVKLAMAAAADHEAFTQASTAEVVAGAIAHDLEVLSEADMVELHTSYAKLGAGVLNTLLNGSPSRRRLAAMIVKDSSADELQASGVVALLAGDDDSSWVLPGLMRYTRSGDARANATLALLGRGPDAAGVPGMLRLLSETSTELWAGHAPALCAALGRRSWAVALLVVAPLAACHGYGGSAVVKVLPDNVKHDIVTEAWTKADDAVSKRLIAAVGGAPCVEKLDKARCVLAEEYLDPAGRYVPAGGVAPGGNARLVAELRTMCGTYVKGFHRPFDSASDQRSHIVAWLSVLPAAEFVELAADLRERNAWSDCLSQVVNAALAGDDVDPAARKYLFDLMEGPGYGTDLPYDMTLATYAQRLTSAHRRHSSHSSHPTPGS